MPHKNARAPQLVHFCQQAQIQMLQAIQYVKQLKHSGFERKWHCAAIQASAGFQDITLQHPNCSAHLVSLLPLSDIPKHVLSAGMTAYRQLGSVYLYQSGGP